MRRKGKSERWGGEKICFSVRFVFLSSLPRCCDICLGRYFNDEEHCKPPPSLLPRLSESLHAINFIHPPLPSRQASLFLTILLDHRILKKLFRFKFHPECHYFASSSPLLLICLVHKITFLCLPMMQVYCVHCIRSYIHDNDDVKKVQVELYFEQSRCNTSVK